MSVVLIQFTEEYLLLTNIISRYISTMMVLPAPPRHHKVTDFKAGPAMCPEAESSCARTSRRSKMSIQLSAEATQQCAPRTDCPGSVISWASCDCPGSEQNAEPGLLFHLCLFPLELHLRALIALLYLPDRVSMSSFSTVCIDTMAGPGQATLGGYVDQSYW